MSYGVSVRGGHRPRRGSAATRLLPLGCTWNPVARPRPLLRGILACVVILAMGSRGIGAQETAPLTKSEVLRLLATGAYSSRELTGILRRSCVTFEATDRDRAHLRSLGAGDDVLEAVVSCREVPVGAPSEATGDEAADEESAAERAGPEDSAIVAAPADEDPVDEPAVDEPPLGELRAGRPAAGEPVGPSAPAARIEPASLRLGAGSTDTVHVRVEQGGRGVAGLGLLLGGPGAPGGEPLRATTDASGRASFIISAGTVARLYQLPLRSVDGRIADGPALFLEVEPGQPARTRVSPPMLRIEPGSETTLRLIADVTDGFGNPIAGRELSLATPDERVVATAVTDERGSAALVFEAADVRRAAHLILRSGGRILAEVPVEDRSPPEIRSAPGSATARAGASGAEARPPAREGGASPRPAGERASPTPQSYTTTSSSRKRSVRSARTWRDALRLSMSSAPIDGRDATSRTAAPALAASREVTSIMAR